jgi:hypothetical protein
MTTSVIIDIYIITYFLHITTYFILFYNIILYTYIESHTNNIQIC